MTFTDQAKFDIRFDWGLDGLCEQLGTADTVVIVDVLSFCTAVETAASRGAIVLPFDRRGEAAEQFASEAGARLAADRGARPEPRRLSLSPLSLGGLKQGERLVLPSANGATLAFRAVRSEVLVVAGCLRNARAVGEFCSVRSGPVALIAAGERWGGYGGSLRPAIEDMIGAGAVAANIMGRTTSPETVAAQGAFREVEDRLESVLADTASGRELVETGYANDVAYAAELNVSGTIPTMIQDRFEAYRGSVRGPL